MIKLFEAFAGYGSQALAMKRLGVDFESVGISEIDKFAIKAYKALHGDVTNYGDISKIDWAEVPDFDMFTYSFPCTDISAAGQQKGLSENSGTRSSLLWECERAITEKRPRILILENVKALVSEKFLPDYHKWIYKLEQLGYTNFAQVLNAKDYGVPQNRERIFVVSVLDGWYQFPEPFRLKKMLKDLLEENVSEKYWMSDKMVDFFTQNSKNNEAKGNGFRFTPTDGDNVAKAITTKAGGRMDDNFINVKNVSKIRKLTPRECFRLMGVDDLDIDKLLTAGISDSQLYKMAGNSIVVDVLYYLFKTLNL